MGMRMGMGILGGTRWREHKLIWLPLNVPLIESKSPPEVLHVRSTPPSPSPWANKHIKDVPQKQLLRPKGRKAWICSGYMQMDWHIWAGPASLSTNLRGPARENLFSSLWPLVRGKRTSHARVLARRAGKLWQVSYLCPKETQTGKECFLPESKTESTESAIRRGRANKSWGNYQPQTPKTGQG